MLDRRRAKRNKPSKGEESWANIDYKDGGYSIPALSSQHFTFWWGRDSKAPNEYFNVSISPTLDSANLPW